MLIWGRIKSPYLKYSFLFLSTYLFCVCACMCICVWSRDSLWILVPSIYHEGYGVELRLLDSAASAFTCHAILLALKYSFCWVCIAFGLPVAAIETLICGGLERFPCLWKKRVWGICDSGMILDKLEQAFTSDGSCYVAKGICVLSTFMVLASYALFLMLS